LDVTDLYNVTKLENPDQTSFSFKANLGELRKYVALDAKDYFVPIQDSKPKVPNQNLKGTVFKNNQGKFEDVDYVIVTPVFLVTQAEKLADFHRSQSLTKSNHYESIYQEFSSENKT
jgi:hypothetical protein